MVTCFGEVLIDCLPTGDLVGGAPFNVAVHLERFGEDVIFLSKIAKDNHGKKIENLLSDSKLLDTLQYDDARKTGYVSVEFKNGEPQYTIHTDVAWQFIDVPETLSSDYIVFGSLGTYFDHNKKSFKQLLLQSPRATKFCDLNLRSPFYDESHVLFCLENSDILKLNEDEEEYVKQILGVESNSEFINTLEDKFDITTILITRGDKDVEVFSNGQSTSIKVVQVSASEFKDPIGAGDSFAATFIYESLQGENFEVAIQRGVQFAAEVCKVSGALPSDLSLYDRP